jgi:hypothetical protein
MKDHKFAVGETVYFASGTGRSEQREAGVFKVVRLLPAEYNDQQYRVKSTVDGHERVVKESQIS